MSREIDETHDPLLASWVPSANDADADFPIQNLPFATFRTGPRGPRVGVAIGDRIVDLRELAHAGLLAGLGEPTVVACSADSLNAVMMLGPPRSTALRRRLSQLLSRDDERPAVENCLVPVADSALLVPADIGDYTDFYASLAHATNVGRLFRPENPLLPNYKWVPIGYHGRASSIVASGHSIRRPHGQRRPSGGEPPPFGPSRMLDYELELGVFVGPGNELGLPVSVAKAEEHLFGVCLLNDWSARDVQAWEYQPLGPFLGKSFATTVSPWVVTLEALAPFRAPAAKRGSGDPAPLPHLAHEAGSTEAGVDITVDAYIQSAQMRRRRIDPLRISRGVTRDLYWTLAQMLAHHTSNGCNLRPGDLLGTGTISGDHREAFGSMLEITRRGAEPLELPSGEIRAFLEDGDDVILRGHCERRGYCRIGFGDCRGRVEPAV